jgi:hypothetical protein
VPTRREEPGTNYQDPDSEYVARVLILIRSASPPLLGEGGGRQKIFSPWPETALGGPAGSVFHRNTGTVPPVKGNQSDHSNIHIQSLGNVKCKTIFLGLFRIHQVRTLTSFES